MRSILIALYPRAWRARYGSEFAALLEESGCGAREVLDLLRGALDAHLRPSELRSPPLERMRGTVAAAICCGSAFALVGAGFAKSTEDGSVAAAASLHTLLGSARLSIELVALAAAAAVLLGGAGIVLRRPGVLRAPLLAAAGFCLCTVLLLTSAAHGAAPFVLWSAAAALAAAYGALGARSELLRAPLEAATLRRGVLAAAALALCMAAITLVLGVYVVGLMADAPAAARTASDPLGLSTAASLLLQFLAMGALSGLCALGADQGLR
ncbi:MAG: hypothetical protein ACR2ND_06450, partial [Solirubrobacteraceae bacterium]